MLFPLKIVKYECCKEIVPVRGARVSGAVSGRQAVGGGASAGQSQVGRGASAGQSQVGRRSAGGRHLLHTSATPPSAAPVGRPGGREKGRARSQRGAAVATG